MSEQNKIIPYLTDLSDKNWELIKPYFSNLDKMKVELPLWRLDGTWERINSALRVKLRIAYDREPEPSAGALDSQYVKTTETLGVNGYEAAEN